MESLYIPGTKNTPQVNLSVKNCQFEIIGSSFSDTVFEEIYSKILNWIDDELPKLNCELNCVFSIDILNSMTYKNIMQILIKFTEFNRNGKNISVLWYFEGDDEDNEELAENLSHLFDIPFTIKAV